MDDSQPLSFHMHRSSTHSLDQLSASLLLLDLSLHAVEELVIRPDFAQMPPEVAPPQLIHLEDSLCIDIVLACDVYRKIERLHPRGIETVRVVDIAFLPLVTKSNADLAHLASVFHHDDIFLGLSRWWSVKARSYVDAGHWVLRLEAAT